MKLVVKYFGHCAALFQVFGQQYFSVSTLTSENQKRFPSLKYTLYFIVLLVILTGQMGIFVSIASSESIEEKLTSKTILNYVVTHSMYDGLILIICVSLIQSFITTPLMKKFYLNCFEIARKSEQDFYNSIDHRRIRRKLFRHYIKIKPFLLNNYNDFVFL